MDDQSTSIKLAPELPAQALEPTSLPVEPEPNQSEAPIEANLPSEAPESPTNASTPVPLKDQNGGVNSSESEVPEPFQVSAPVSAPASLNPSTSQPQSPAQRNQTGFIRALLAKAQAKIQSNKQNKLDKIILFAQKKKIIANEDVQKLLHVSSATATRYLVKLVQQGRLARVGNPRDAKYQFLH